METGETNGEDDPGVLVDAGRWSSPQLVQVLAVGEQRQVVVTSCRHLDHRPFRALDGMETIMRDEEEASQE